VGVVTASLGVVVPAYRPDVAVLRGYVENVVAELDPDTVRVELDAPAEGVPAQLADSPATVEATPERRGKGAAVTAGFEALDTDRLAFADADASTPVSDLGRIVDALGDGETALAVGSRRHPDAAVHTSQSPMRQRLGDGFAWLARRLLDTSLHDYQCGAKAITADAWQQLRHHLSRPGFAWDVELVALAGALELGVREIPIEWHDHPESTVPPVRASLRLASGLVAARLRAQRLQNARLDTVLDSVGTGPAVLVERDGYSHHDD
jgi:hypothetical protein